MNSEKFRSFPAVFTTEGFPRSLGFACLLLIPPVFLTGCDQLNRQKVENPVIGAPPPRIQKAAQIRMDGKAISDANNQSNVFPVSRTSEAHKSLDDYPGTQIVALVNGSPILASEVLGPYEKNLDLARKAVQEGQITPAQFEELQNKILKKDLETHIERKLLVEALLNMLPPEGLKNLEKDNERYFEGEIERLKKELKVETREDLEIELQKQGLSLDRLRDNIFNQRMAYGYLSLKAEAPPVFSRRELYEYYQAHLEDYAVPEQVRWQQIVVYFQEHGGRSSSLEILKKAVDELKQGRSFGAVAAEYSDGPRAKDGGQWDWTKAGSLSDKTIEEELFNLPSGQISRVIEGKTGFHLVRVNERQSAAYRPFTDEQENIRSLLEKQAKEESSRKILEELRATAIVETIFDGEKNAEPGRTALR